MIRTVRADEVEVFREVRLASLADVPDAWSATYEEEARRRTAAWARRLAALCADPDRSAFFACTEAGVVVGCVSGTFEARPRADAHLYSLWVAPHARGWGGGQALVEAVSDWARDRGARRLVLQVTIGNDPASRLYERLGFRDTGGRAPLRPGSPLTLAELALDLR